MTDGVMYIASGEQYLSEAEYSATSVREQMPDVNIALVTDHENIEADVFDDILDLTETYPDSGVSTLRPGLSPYDRTLFLDTDTFLAEPVPELFDILEDYNMAFTQSPGRLAVPGLPDPWVEFNTGVISYESSTATEQFFERWLDIYQNMLKSDDIDRNQPSFAHAVAESDVDYFLLPREYNCRVPRFGYLAHEAKVVHGRDTVPLADIAARLNENPDRRVHWPKIRRNLVADLQVVHESDIEYRPLHIAFRFKRSVQRNGLRHALRESYRELSRIVGRL